MTDPASVAGAAGQQGGKVPQAIVLAAAEWMVRLQDSPSPEDLAACLAWRHRDPRHELAWQRLAAMGERLQAGTAPVAGLAGRVLAHPGLRQPARRQALKTLAVAGGIGWLAWQGYAHPARRRWLADASTGVGRQRTITLPDGGELILNTASAVDIDYGRAQRRVVLLAGEILVRTGADAQGRPFVLQTRVGEIRPVGTRFTVRDLAEGEPRVMVAVQEGAVELQPAEAAGPPLRVPAGQRASLTPWAAALVAPGGAAGDAWVRGMLVADQMPLRDFLAELGRYRHGVLRCQRALAALPVTGAFPLSDTDRSLAMLTEVLPVRLQSLTPYWVTVAERH